MIAEFVDVSNISPISYDSCYSPVARIKSSVEGRALAWAGLRDGGAGRRGGRERASGCVTSGVHVEISEVIHGDSGFRLNASLENSGRCQRSRLPPLCTQSTYLNPTAL